MIIQTRYRDIPFEEARKCAGPNSIAILDVNTARAKWEKRRGKVMTIQTPQTIDSRRNNSKCACDGPWYRVLSIDGRDISLLGAIACTHLAEIGD